MRKVISTFLLASTIWSCDITKQASKSKTDTELKEVYEQKQTRLGDTVRFQIPKVSYKDTIIYRTSSQGTTLRTIYDKQGNAESECISSAIELVTKLTRELNQTEKVKDKEKTEEVNTTWILYGFIAIVLIMFFGMFMLYLLIQKRLPKQE